MKKFLILQATYQNVEFALYNGQSVIETGFVDKMQASSLLMNKLCILLQNNGLTFNHLEFIGASQGPAPFTTLRSMIATINGVGFATKVPLVGCDGLATFVKSYYKNSPTIALLNAFSGDAYYAFYDGTTLEMGWDKPENYLECLKQKNPDKTFTFIGNAAPEDKKEGPDFPSLEIIATKCCKLFKKNGGQLQLLPLHMKTMNYKKSC